MKTITSVLTIFSLSIGLLTPLSAAPTLTKSGLDDDPEVVYLEHYTSIPIKFLLIEDTALYASKTGKSSRKIGTLSAGSSVQLLAMNENAYRISGKGKYGLIKGWVSPKSVASQDPKFVENLHQLYLRQMKVNKLIKNQQVAIGMTVSEVVQSLGEPTKKEDKITKDGRSGTYEFIQLEEEKHYRYVTDARTGNVYKQLSHITTEEKSNITVEFESDVVTAITSKEDNGPGKVNIVVPPIIFRY
ncbi:MAG: hypothetical protein ACSHX6_16275 [Akkermansiaceae bacterium]